MYRIFFLQGVRKENAKKDRQDKRARPGSPEKRTPLQPHLGSEHAIFSAKELHLFAKSSNQHVLRTSECRLVF